MKSLRIGLAVFALLVYLAFPTKNYYWDGISFAQNIEDAARWPQLLHPNHLIYNLLGWGVYRGFAGKVRALYILQAMNAVWAAMALYWLSGIVATAVQSSRAMLLLSALFAFAGTWWRYAEDAGAYIPSIALLIACAVFLTPGKRPRPVVVALLHTAAMLIHQLGLFLFPAALFALWHQHKEGTPSAIRMRSLALYTGLTGAITIGAYALGFTALNGSFSVRPFLIWMTSYAEDAAFSFGLFRNAGWSLRSWGQLFFVGRPSLLRFSDPPTILLLLLCVSALILLLLALRRTRFQIRVHQPSLFRFALLWILTYALFLFFWLPQNTFYKVFGLPGVVLLVASCWEPGREPQARGAGTAFVALLALSNLTLGIIPYSRASSNDIVAFAFSLNQALNPGSVVLFRNLSTDDWFARYFNPQSRWQHAGTAGAIDAELHAGRPVWLETTAVEHFATEDSAWFQDRTRSSEWRELIQPHRRVRFVRLNAP